MSSPYVLSNYALQYLTSNIANRFRMYVATLNPVQIVTVSQDVQTDQYGQYVNISNVDLLSGHMPPYMPQANMGPNRIGFVGEALMFDGSRSTQRSNLSATGHTWTATGNPTITTYTNLSKGDQCMMIWAQPGLYTVTLTVSDRFGSSMTGTRQVMIYADRDNTPTGVIQLSGLTGSIDNGGWSGQFVASSQNNIGVLSPDALPVGSYQPIVVMAETEYEVSPGNWQPVTIGQYGAAIPGQFYDDPRIVFSGYVQSGTATQDSNFDTLSFQIQTVDMILQQAGIHNIGYYNASYGSFNTTTNEPLYQNVSTAGKGQLVTDLTSEDIYRSLMTGYVSGNGLIGGHSNVGQYHDLILWRDFLPVPDTNSQLFYLTYSGLTANEGTIWAACQLLAQNEFSSIWCERNGSICVGPIYNMRGYEMMNEPTIYPRLPLSQIETANELNKNTTLSNRLAYLHFLFGPNPLPVSQDVVYAPPRNLSSLVGPPIAYHISDTPIFDTDTTAPQNSGLFPWLAAMWPQDLSIRPVSSSIPENYTTRSAFVKLIGTLVTGQTVWASWYPLTVFGCNGIMTAQQPGGSWDVEDQLTLADITAAAQKSLSWQYLWETARRRYLMNNAPYQVTVDFGMTNWMRLHDVFAFTRQKAEQGPLFRAMPFYVNQITFNIDLDNHQWTTEITGNMMTSVGIGPAITPPCPVPTN